MAKTASKELKKLGSENSYTKEFFEELCQKIDLEDPDKKSDLGRSIILAAQAYIRQYNEYLRQLAAHEIKQELKKVVNHIDKASESLIKIYASGNYGEDIVNNLHDVISEKYSSLRGMLTEIKRGDGIYISITSPLRSLPLLEAMADAIDRTLKNYKSRKTTPRSIALYHWIMILSAQLEPIIGHKLEQSRYYKTESGGEYISKKKISDSELLLFIIEPLDPNVTISQIETAIKDTRKERYDAPWDDYFPKW
ncbi:MAG: hypothetical protein KDI61_11705 [Alphaproteobacteria bacterium]|nr:hypothetical protein [Alphaproteobacteria bacterium]